MRNILEHHASTYFKWIDRTYYAGKKSGVIKYSAMQSQREIDVLTESFLQYGLFPTDSPKNVCVMLHSFNVDFHRHDFIELIYVFRGSCQTDLFEDGDLLRMGTFALNQGELFILDTNAVHRISASKDARVFNILIRREFLENVLRFVDPGNGLLAKLLREDGKCDPFYMYCCHEIVRSCEGIVYQLIHHYFVQDILNMGILHAQLIQLFSHLNKNVQKILSPSQPPVRIEEILSYIDDNISTVSLADAANYFHYSQSYMSRIIVKESGKSFSRLMRDRRMQKAQSLLRTSQEPISEIASQIGIQDKSWFYKLFRQEFGLTPQQFREKQRGGG